MIVKLKEDLFETLSLGRVAPVLSMGISSKQVMRTLLQTSKLLLTSMTDMLAL